MFLVILACAERPDGPISEPGSPTDTDTSPLDPPTSPPDTGTTPVTEPTMPVLLLCGGGTEGDVGDATSWSAVYADLLRNGDVTGDGLVRVAVISEGEETDWVPAYFESLGADEAFNVLVDTRDAADAVVLDDVDAVFLKGGDQGAYYDLWNDTALETAIQSLYRQTLGGVGGTSAGAMSISALALAGGMDLVSADVLEDSHTPYLRDDSDGGTGVHDDFFALLDGETLVDTHFSNRGRLARLAGTLAEAIDVYALAAPLGIGLDEQTCATVQGGVATVSGVGAVTFLRPGTEAAVRVPGDPLIWADLQLDRLVAGGTFDLSDRTSDLGGDPVGTLARLHAVGLTLRRSRELTRVCS
ncbi:MAG: cyanophycinase [Deltaproteobacteria bacterium]|nr:cyanophycinase [Deltaproteobacteria bacterium]